MERPHPPVEVPISSQERSPVILPSAQTIYEQVQRENVVVLKKITMQPRYATEERFVQQLTDHNTKNGIIDTRRSPLTPTDSKKRTEPLEEPRRESSAA